MSKMITLLLLVLFACAPNDVTLYTEPDAGLVADASPAPDAHHPPQQKVCNAMGNLPFARTVTLADGQALSPGLINEIQDMFAGDRRQHFRRQGLPSCWTATGTAPTIVANPQAGGLPIPVWKLPANQVVRASIPYEAGDVFEDVLLDIYGDGVTDWTTNIQWASDLTASPADGGIIASTGAFVTNLPASWTRVDVGTTGLAIETLLGTGSMEIEITLGAAGSQIYLGNVIVILHR